MSDVLPTIQITPYGAERPQAVLRPVTESELTASGLWTPDNLASTFTFLPENDQAVLETPAMAIERAAGIGGHLWGVHALGESSLRLVGVAGLWKPEGTHPGTAAFILDPTQRGKGVGTAVQTGLTRYVFNYLEREVVWAQTLDVNTASKRAFIATTIRPSFCRW